MYCASVSEKTRPKRRSGCPVSISLEILGDRWSLLIVRDMMVRGYRTFGEFLASGEGIASNILSGRLRTLRAAGIVTTEPAPDDARSVHYRLTEKGIALAPVVFEMLIWAAHYEKTGAPCGVVEQMERNRAAVLKETCRRWRERDPEPILPAFTTPTRPQKGKAKR